jgi:ABC-type dipeptide/oligopeptide/nickel transport system permease component/ABC-type transport system substrate-binding protein
VDIVSWSLHLMLRKLTHLLVAAGGCCLGLWLASWATRPSLTPQPLPYSPQEIRAAAIAGKPAFDPANPPSVIADETVHPQNQSPILADLVQQGLLPPLASRMPADPPVLKGVEGVGKYGGTWMQLSASTSDVSIIMGFRLSGPYLVRFSTCGYPIKPFIAQSVTPSPDRRQWLITLRRGLKWSDGAPFTADDILYWWLHEANDPAISSNPPHWMSSGGAFGHFEKINQYQLRVRFDHPYPLFLETLATSTDLTGSPRHYLIQFHPHLGDALLVRHLQALYQLPSARSVYDFMRGHDNPDCPRLWPWIYRKYSANSPQVYVRNPYYFAVDEAGNQLPYIDRMQFQIVDAQVLPISAANGESSMQNRSIRYEDFTELMSRRTIAGTQILQWYPGTRSQYVINPDLNRHADPSDPESVWKAKYLSDKHFRQALSLAINRQAIIHASDNDQCEASQVEAGPLSIFHSENLAHAFTQYDPNRASRLLDDLGLTGRDGEGFRTFPDGSRMSFFFDFSQYTGIGPAQFVADDWAAVGIRIIIRERSRSLFYLEKDAGLFDFDVWSSESDVFPLLSPRDLVPINGESFFATGWARWFAHDGMFGDPEASQKGCIPVPHDSPMYTAMADYVAAIQSVDLPTQKRLVADICDIAADNLWTINIATALPDLVVMQNDMHNVPKVAMTGAALSSPSNTGIETYFFGHPHDTPGAIAETRDSILNPGLRPISGDDGEKSNSPLAHALRVLPAALVIGCIGYLGFRYRYIGRRLAIMVPTLLVISVIVFIIIQLPPGDYLTTRLAQLEESGDPQNGRVVEELRFMFHFDNATWQKYFNWMGVKWLFTFEPEDAGLLEGNLGRSMATTALVNQMIGERLTLTILLSLGTIVFTWGVAFPIGIYSAVRQYSLGDYALTLIGFIGMCVPPFLFAIVLMAIAGVSGLFSPEFSVQPEWNWPKVLDLLKHLWIPIVVLGAGGTAGMIRIMRANLLDELRKPYVITARAKGVRPLKLLLKYPVRMSLNPFISGIGGLFPGLISGGAIVSIVLTLPTIGPLMVDALRDQDMYLAGSLLMLLNILSVLGTLISDLLLLWLDPRIRLGGGTR